MKKEPKCKICGGAHYKSFCFQAPRKQIASRKPLRASRKPLRSKSTLNPSRKQKPLKRAKIKSKSTNPRKLLVAKLDRVFSQYIRRKDANNDMARCITCGAIAHWRTMQNGHFISRRKMTTRWDEMNCHVQCKNCNEFLDGNLDKYEQFILNTYGDTATLSLQQKSQQSEKISNFELEKLIIYYQEKLASLL